MKEWIEKGRYLVEILTPKQDCEDIEAALSKFAEKYRTVFDHGYVVSITDNPLGKLSFTAAETLEATEVPIDPERILIHLNTFHQKADLDEQLAYLIGRGIKYILAVSGDGSERLHRLEPEEIGIEANAVTSVELISYIRREFPGAFRLGVAFNPYEPQDEEREKMKRKIAAGAEFAITQPVIGRDENVDWLASIDIPVYVEAWMSKRIDLVSECVGYKIPEGATPYDPIENLKALMDNYRGRGFYLALLGLKKQIHNLPGLAG